jgi:hypothetical protein
MTSVVIIDNQLRVKALRTKLPWASKKLDVPLDNVVEARLYDEKRDVGRRGIFAPALSFREVIEAGTKMEQVFWQVGDPARAIVIELREHPYARIIVEVEDPQATLQMIAGALSNKHHHHPSAQHEVSPKPAVWFVRHLTVLTTSYFCLSAFFLFTIRMPEHAADPLLYWDFSYFSLPAALIIFGITYKYRVMLYAKYAKKRTPSQVWWNAVFLCLFGVFFFWPYLTAANALGAKQIPITFYGTINGKEVSHGRHWTYIVDIYDANLRREMSFSVSQSFYNNSHIGQFYQERMFIGRFGIPYRWVWQEP